LFPVFLPDEGTFDWVDWYLSENPATFTELSDRAISEWALMSGVQRQKTQSWKTTNDKPDTSFGIKGLDDCSVKESLAALASTQRRSYIVMEVKGNLTKEDRIAALKKWGNRTHKRVAQVMIGDPEEAYRKRSHDMILAEKQDKLTKEFKEEQAMVKEQKMLEREVRIAKRKAEKARKKEEEAKKKAEEGASEEVKDEEKPEVKDEDISEDEKMEVDDEKPPVATLTAAEKQVRFRKQAASDLSATVISTSFNKFCLPDDTEGFDEVRYTWSSPDLCEQYLKDWVLERKLTTRIEDLNPSDWFREKWKDWQKDLQTWHLKHVEYKDPVKRQAVVAAAQAAAQAAPQSKALLMASSKAPPAQKPEAKADEKEEEGKKEETQEAEHERKEDEDDDKDPMQALEEEMDKEDMDIFGVEDVCDVKDGQGTPLFCAFAFEDWALLSLRFELHLLVHSFRADCGDPERTGIHPEHLSFYYQKYYKKALNTKNYGVETVEDLIALVNDTVIQNRSKVVESQVTDDLETNEIFVKLTEEARRDRQRRIDAGDDSAVLKFLRPQQAAGAKTKSPALAGLSAGSFAKAAPNSSTSSDAASTLTGVVVRPPGAGNVQRPAFGKQPNWAKAASQGANVRPNIAAVKAAMAKAMASGKWGGFGNWGGWRG